MSHNLRVALAMGDYDITRPLIDGEVRPQGVDLTVMTMPSPQRHWRTLRHLEFDAAELSLASYVAYRGRGLDELVAIPVFPHRRFRHGYVFVSGASQITAPAELAGRSVGLRSWQTTAGVWLRGILAEHHGLAVADVDWVAQDGEDVPLDLPPGVRLRRVPEGRTVTGMCAEGAIDGLIYPELPRAVREGHPTIRRLFQAPKDAEQAYFRTTGIFPIMHVVVIRADLLASRPWLARNLLASFQQAKCRAYARLEDPRTVSLAWLRTLQEEERSILGADPWRYGLGADNRHNLATFLGYARAQGLAGPGLALDDLFFPSTLEDPPAFV